MISWISPETLNQHIDRLLQRASDAADKAQGRRKKNVIDPFSSLAVASTFSIQKPRMLENVLGSVPGWQNHDSGYDLECARKQAIAEIKNKHNTMNAANRREVEQDLRTALRQKRGDWRAFLVHVIPRTPNRYSKSLGGNLFEIDGASFYALATGEDDAIHDLFDHLTGRLSPSGEITKHCKGIFARSLPPRIRQSFSLHTAHSPH